MFCEKFLQRTGLLVVHEHEIWPVFPDAIVYAARQQLGTSYVHMVQANPYMVSKIEGIEYRLFGLFPPSEIRVVSLWTMINGGTSILSDAPKRK